MPLFFISFRVWVLFANYRNWQRQPEDFKAAIAAGNTVEKFLRLSKLEELSLQRAPKGYKQHFILMSAIPNTVRNLAVMDIALKTPAHATALADKLQDLGDLGLKRLALEFQMDGSDKWDNKLAYASRIVGAIGHAKVCRCLLECIHACSMDAYDSIALTSLQPASSTFSQKSRIMLSYVPET